MAVHQNFQTVRLNYLSIPSVLLISKKPTQLKSPLAELKPTLVSLQNEASVKPITSKTTTKQHSFTITYLINSCGLSSESAISASQKVRFQSPERPDLVLALLENYGFSKIQISNLIRKRPVLLLANPENILLPKLEFFQSIGLSSCDLARTLSSDPTLLTRSLENQIIPSYDFLKSVLLSNEKIVSALKRTTWIFLEDPSKNLMPNVAFLRELGVPQKCVALLLTHFPEAVMQKHEDFCGIVREVKEIGFEPRKSMFVLAVHALSGKGNKSIWEKCFEVYKRWGWSKDDILTAFKKHPHSMMLSEKKIMKSMDYFVNKMGWPSRMIAQCPVVLFFSLERRIIPRCSVFQILLSKGLIKEDFSLTTVLLPVEKRFLERFVTKYQEEVPDLLSVYQGKVKFEGA
ncbi:Transcription termination factor [Theobroma cacao]|uniref:Mitochondrial transcription termination factor family protein n=1 Tax=Theobroma cacao TaxID=3641 RepID=A0A061DY70_THECC|nr:Mitochondrial transcription termination factor family protein [Theobroma cacao]WRX07642.1 Transcription termination factor [Theobroma cacao]